MMTIPEILEHANFVYYSATGAVYRCTIRRHGKD